MSALSQLRLKEVLHYNPATGAFTWIAKASKKTVIGSLAGCQTGAGYIVIGIDGRIYYAHQLAYLYMTGSWVERVDHRDCDGFNNRWTNLRPATSQQNALNARRASSNTSGFKGVSWHKAAGKWAAHIILHGRKRHLGLFINPADAHAAYISAAMSAQPDFARAS
ncbi:HNH endonuclease [Sphingobium sp.]|uniref:HNH endonuclease n=1 Tax=Sphingobium sp. TaxID=1912891 RepID=UPI00257CAC72|nr:HNH endonuclease [Sphingobium sp.]MBR2268296.1 HNH endonuclease [Sphingobium sp.]